MQQKHCKEGDELDNLYTQNTLVWGVAETRKRAAAGSKSIEWFEVVRRAEEAKAAYEKAKCDYLDHVIACPLCDAHVFASPSVRLGHLLLNKYWQGSRAA